MRKVLFTLTILCSVLSTAPSLAQWINKPAGFSTVFDCAMTGNFCPGPGVENVYDSGDFTTRSGQPVSPSGVLHDFLCAGCGTGNGQWIVNLNRPREVYVGTIQETNAQFEGYQNNTNKNFFVHAPGPPPTGSGDNSFLVYQGLPGAPCKTFKWYQQGIVKNSDSPNTFGMTYCGPSCGDGTGWFNPNTVHASRATVCHGTGPHLIEVYLKVSTTFTSRDGIVRWFVDGFMVGNHVGVNLSPNGLLAFQVNHAWDSTPEAGGCAVMGRNCALSWDYWWDHIHIATGSGGGGTVPPPPPPPPVPPLAPADLRFGWLFPYGGAWPFGS